MDAAVTRCTGRPFVFALVWLLTIVCCPALHAQRPPDSGEARATRLVIPSLVDPAAAATRWTIWMDGTGTDGERNFDAFLQISHESGIWELDAHASAILASRTFDARDNRTARLERATRLSPDSPSLHWQMTEVLTREQPWAVHLWAPEAFESMKTMLNRPSGVVTTTHAAWSLVHGAMLPMAVLLALALLLRSASRAAFDLRLLLFRLPTWGQVRVLVWFSIVTASIILQLHGLVASALILGGIYARWRDLPAIMLLVVAAIVHIHAPTPPWVDLAAADQRARASVAPCDAMCVASLTRDAGRGASAASMALAWVNFRTGTSDGLASARAWLDRVPADSFVFNRELLEGHLDVVAGDVPAADAHYRLAYTAASGDLERGTAAVTLYRTSTATGMLDAARQMAVEASATGHPWTEEWRVYDGRSQNRVLPAAPLRAMDVLDSMHPPGFNAWLNPEPLLAHPDTLLFCILAFASAAVGRLMAWMRARSEACRICDTPTSRRVLPEAFDQRECVWCCQQTDKTLRLEFEQRHAREYRAARRQAAGRWMRALGSVFAPGFTGIATSAPLTGTLASILLACTWSAATFRAARPTDLLLPQPQLFWLSPWFWAGTLALAAVVVSVIGILVASRRERA
jgi:hypothetical protein